MARWYFARDGQSYGPFTSAELKQFAATGQLLPDDNVLKEDTQKWVTATSVKGLFPQPEPAPLATPSGLPGPTQERPPQNPWPPDQVPLPTWALSTRGESSAAELLWGDALRLVCWLMIGAGVILGFSGGLMAIIALIACFVAIDGADYVWLALPGLPAGVLGFGLLFLVRPFACSTIPPITLNKMAIAAGLRGELADALVLFAGALKKDPGLFGAYFNRGLILLATGDPSRRGEALEDLTKTIEFDPGWATAYLLRGNLRKEYGDKAGAEQDFLAALQITEAAIRFDEKVKAAAQSGDLKAYQKVIARIPDDWFTPSTMGGYLAAVQRKLVSVEEVRTELKALRQ